MSDPQEAATPSDPHSAEAEEREAWAAFVAGHASRDAEVAELKAKIAELEGGPHIEGCWRNCGKFPCSCVCHQTGVNGKSARSASSPVEGGN